MNAIILSLFLAASPTPSSPPPPAMACPAPVAKKIVKRKPLKKKVVTPPAPVVVKEVEVKEVVREVPVPVPCPEPAPASVKKPAPKPAAKVVDTTPAKDPELLFGMHLALGAGVKGPGNGWGSVSGMLGARVQYKPIHLGGEIYTSLDRGLGLEAMVWTYQGKSFSHHLDLGVQFTGDLFQKFSVNDVPRQYDVTAGTGFEVPLTKNMDLTLDWKMRIPDPFFVGGHGAPVMDADGNQIYGSSGRYLDIKHVLGNGLVQSQVFVGLLFRP